MSRPLQLHIPKPCHENWENMLPNGKGRHCAACQKTVVDLTRMSDAEIIQYFSKASGSVCGRASSGQLNRKMEMPRPPRKNPWIGWPVLLSGLLFAAEEAGTPRVGKVAIHQCERRPGASDPQNVTVGEMLVQPDTSAVVQVGERHDTIEVFKMGELTGDALTVVVPPSLDTGKVIERREEPDSMAYSGGIVVTEPPEDTVGVDSRMKRRALTRWGRNAFDTVKQIVADSLAVMGIGKTDSLVLGNEIKDPSVEVTIYPNPVVRGASLNLSWKNYSEDGRVNLYSISGALVRSWMIQGGNATLTLTMPADIAAGVYVLQLTTKNGAYTRKVVVE